jgi:hypothetical protein
VHPDLIPRRSSFRFLPHFSFVTSKISSQSFLARALTNIEGGVPMPTFRNPLNGAAGIALGLMLLSVTAGCGLSYDYQRRSLEGAGPSALCYAATDPRAGGFEVRRRAAQDIIDQNGIQCDYAAEAQLHAGQAQAQQMGIANSINMIGLGQQMLQPRVPASGAMCSQVGGSVFCSGTP